jgi:poly(3-hydroxybutyrate) depolymerase
MFLIRKHYKISHPAAPSMGGIGDLREVSLGMVIMVSWQTCYLYSVVVGMLALGLPGRAAEPPEKSRGIFDAWDANRDGVLTREEVPAGPRRLFDQIDRNADGQISFAEHRDRGRLPARGSIQVPGVNREANQTATPLQHDTIRQVWSQEPGGFDRPYVVHQPQAGDGKWPVLLVLHGNGGSAASMIGRWAQLFPGWLVVAAQGYERSWNVSKERSKAPDVEFVKKILRDIGQRFPQADPAHVSLLGSSNGAGMVFRLLIELDETVRVRHAVTLVSSLTAGQYHDGQFWKRANEATAVYDMPVVPVGKRRILTIHGTADTVVPYGGGRGPGGTHLSAQATAYAWAVQQGYQGRAVPDDAGRACGEGLIRYDYPPANVSHIKVVAGHHGLGPAKTAVEAIVRKFLLAE